MPYIDPSLFQDPDAYHHDAACQDRQQCPGHVRGSQASGRDLHQQGWPEMSKGLTDHIEGLRERIGAIEEPSQIHKDKCAYDGEQMVPGLLP